MIEILVVLVALAVALLLIVAHKVRRIHLVNFDVLNEARAIRLEVESLYAQLQAADGLSRLLDLPLPLPAMRGWAGSPDFLLQVAQMVRDRKPQAVLECSSGVSTLVIARCLQQNGSGHVWSLEHEPEFAAKTREMLVRHGVADWATVLDAPLTEHADGVLWYDLLAVPNEVPPVRLLVVDGPPQSGGPMARAPAFPKLRARLAPGAEIFVDDAVRDGEKAMVEAWLSQEPRLKIEQRPAEKGLTVVRLPS